ncbi:MAG: glycerol-3-phosphate acyltransferase [Rhodospirillales bacterium]|nr:glycerol-3-phosphate acyltransferase [Rhodospirillales bacterium]
MRAAGLGDIRKVGSGNIGATNVLRVGGKGLDAATLVLDALKGLIPVLIADQLGQLAAVGAAAGAVLGHMFPVWLVAALFRFSSLATLLSAAVAAWSLAD